MTGGQTRLSRRARRICAVWAVGWVAAIFAGALVVDRIEVRFPYAAALARSYHEQRSPVVAALGSSRMAGFFSTARMNAYLAGVLPERRLTTFNAAVAAGALTIQEDVLKALLPAGPKPEALIIEVNVEWVHRRENWLIPRRDVTWGNVIELAPDHWSRHGSRLVASRLLPIFDRRSELRQAVWTWWRQQLDGNAPPQDPLLAGLVQAAPATTPTIPPVPVLSDLVRENQLQQAKQSARRLAGFSPTGSAVKALERMLSTCDAKGIPVILVDPPICSPVRQSFAVAESAYRAYLAELLRRHPRARYYDARAVLPDNAFIDSHHVNDYGQYLMCRFLADEVLPDAFAAFSPTPSSTPILGRRTASLNGLK